MKFNTLGSKIGLGYGMALTMFGIVVVTTLIKIIDVDRYSNRINKLQVPEVNSALILKAKLNRSLSALRGWVVFGDAQYETDLQKTWRDMDEVVDELFNKSRNSEYTDKNLLLNKLSADLSELRGYQKEISRIAQTPENFPGLLLLANEAAPRASVMLELITEMIELEAIESNSSQRKKLLKVLADFRSSLASGIAAIRAYLLTNDKSFRDNFNQDWQINGDRFLAIEQFRPLLNKDQERAFIRLAQLREQFALLPPRMFVFREGDLWDQAKMKMDLYVAPIESKVQDNIDKLVQSKMYNMEQDFSRISDEFNLLVNMASTLFIVAIILSCLMAIWLTRLITRPINKVVFVADSISQGCFDIDTNIQGSEEAQRLGLSLTNMTNMLKRIASHASSVAKGDYAKDFEPISEQDHLGLALKQMTANLRRTTQDTLNQNWLISGQAGLAEKLRGDLGVDDIAQYSMNYLAQYTGAKVGALYFNKEDTLSLVASYAYNTRRVASTSYKIGEGLVGQVAKEKKTILFSEVPKEHIHYLVDTGLGESYPDSILVTPLINTQTEENRLVGVLVLAGTQQFNKHVLDLLEKVAEAIAIAVSSAQSKVRLQDLLDESQQQAEELQCQQEELRSANEELEEQAQSLKQSEEELRVQSDSLVNTNQVLELRTKELETQKLSVENKNQQVERASFQLEKKAKELEIASKYKSEFLANMSHELRTPLNSLLILSQTLSRNKNGNLSEEQVEDAKVIYSGGKSLLNLINDILDLSKVEAGKLQLYHEEISVKQIAEKLTAQFKALAADKNLKFTVLIDPQVPTTFISDGQRAEQVLRNLISNALKFTESGFVKITVKTTTSDTNFNLASLQNQDSLAFVVEDSGIGIAVNKQREIFEAFQQADGTTSRAFGGTGLGLTISRELAALLGGEIQLESEPGHGSRFTFYLPVKGNQPIEDEVADETLATSIKPELINPEGTYITDDRDSLLEQDKSILIIEDDKPFAHTLVELSRARGFKCLASNRGKDALALVMQFSPTAIILDMGLPDMDGLMVLESLKSSPLTRDIPVHIISAEDQQASTLKKGAIGFLTKPAELSAIDDVFAKFESLIHRDIKHILLIEDDENSCRAIRSLLNDKGINISNVSNGEAAKQAIRQTHFDCCILDYSLPDMTGLEWLETIRDDNQLLLPPTIIYTGRELDDDEYHRLLEFTDKIVIKCEYSADRLQDEVSLFLHSLSNKHGLSRPEIRPADCSSLEGKTVLLVDDDLRNTYALSKVLKEHGLQVIMADNGELALQKMGESEQIDLVLMDIMMPVMDGYEAMRHIRKQHSNTLPIIALTAKAMADDREKSIQAGASDYLSKPVDVDQLISMLKVWLYH